MCEGGGRSLVPGLDWADDPHHVCDSKTAGLGLEPRLPGPEPGGLPITLSGTNEPVYPCSRAPGRDHGRPDTSGACGNICLCLAHEAPSPS